MDSDRRWRPERRPEHEQNRTFSACWIVVMAMVVAIEVVVLYGVVIQYAEEREWRMKKRMVLTIIVVVMLVLLAAAQSFAVGKYCLAFWREAGYYEKGGTGGMHVLNVHVWDENGNPLANKTIMTDGGLNMGTTDAKGQLEIPLYEPNSYPIKVSDGSNLSDVSPGFSTYRAPDWGHYCFECGFMYKSDSGNPGTFDLDYVGVFSSTAGQPCELSAPKTDSIAFYGTKPDMGYYCSDDKEIGGSAASVGQTFVATGNRVVACKAMVLGNYPMKYQARIRDGGPSGTVLGSVAVSPDTGSYEYLKTLTKWGVSGVTVTPGNTYFLEIKNNAGGNIQAYRVKSNNYSGGCYYEGTTAFTGKELMGHVVCMSTTGGSTYGAISGNVKDGGGANVSGATVSTTSGGYTGTTDASGNYTLANVGTGTYDVVASKSGYSSQTQTGKTVSNAATTTVNFTITAQTGIVAEDFNAVPSWTSTFDATWGSAATFSSVAGGQSGNFMQASRSSQGSSARVKVYAVPANTNITVSCYMKCPSYANSYWMETACKLGSYTAQDFDANSATWTLVKKFSNTGTNGNGSVWTNYSVTVNTGSNTQISIGYKHGSSGYTGPTVGWDTFRIQ